MKKLIMVLCVALAGCSTTVPVARKFPEVPATLTEPAAKLQPLTTDNPQLSDLISNANDNYTEYYRLKEKYNSWIEWYNTQREIFESVK